MPIRIPSSFISDRGRNFLSNAVAELCNRMDIKHYKTSSYHLESNSTCERYNRTLAQSLRSYIDDEQENWCAMLPGILMAYRKTECIKSTGFSPFQMLFGQEMRSPLDVTLDVDPVSKRLSASAEAYVQKLKKRVDLTLKIAKDSVETAQDKHKQQHDKRSKDPEFRLGQRVLVYNPKIPKGKSAKLHLKWTGPYYITDFEPNHTFGLHNSKTHKKLTSLIHANRLKPYEDPDDRDEDFPNTCTPNDNINVSHHTGSQSQSSQSIDNNNGTQTTQADSQYNSEYGIVQDLLACSRRQGKKVYKVKWKDCSRTTWEPGENIPEFLIRDFHVNKTQSGKMKEKHRHHRLN